MIEDILRSKGITLKNPPSPVGSYIPVLNTGNLIFLSGQIPTREENGRREVVSTGKVGVNVSLDEARNAAIICILNALSHLKYNLGSLEKIKRIVKLTGFVNSSDDFVEQHKVIDAASDFLYEIFGEKGKHVRTSVGVPTLPLNSSVEIELVVEI